MASKKGTKVSIGPNKRDKNGSIVRKLKPGPKKK